MPLPTNTERPIDGARLLDSIEAHGCERPAYLRAAAAILERAIEGGVQAVISLPPRHGKTTLAVHAVAMALAARGRVAVGYFTYNGASAQSTALKVAQVTTIATRSKDERRVWTSAGGSALIVGAVGNAVVSERLDVLLIVDPVNNAREAADAGLLLAQWQWLQRLRARLMPGGSVVILGTRWSAADMIGCALRTGGWEHINLPALDAHGAALSPWLWSTEVLAQIRASLGERAWAALYMGEPAEEWPVPAAPRAVAVVEP